MQTLLDMVKEVQQKSGRKLPNRLTFPPTEDVVLTHELIKKASDEYAETMMKLKKVKSIVEAQKVFVEIAGALGKLLYVIAYFSNIWGINMGAVTEEICFAMSQIESVKPEDLFLKIQPDIAGVLGVDLEVNEVIDEAVAVMGQND